MATRTIKARVEIDGEKQYKQALAELNSGNKVLASEMKKLQAEYKGNADSVEFLNKKGDLLQRQLQQQKDKVQTLRDALNNAAQKYGEADKRTQDWVVKLNNAEAAQFDLEHAIEENNQALEHNGETMLNLGDTVDNLASKLGIRIPEEAKKALNGMEGLSSGTVAKMAVAAAAVAAFIKVVKELDDVTLEVASQVDKYVTESKITNIATETLQVMDYAAPLIDTDAETIKGAMTKITRAMGDVNNGNEETAAKFQDLGVSIYDTEGQLRSAEDVFYEVIDSLGQMDNETERDAAAMALMGKSAQDLNPLILAGSDAMREYAEEAKEVGYVLSEDQVAALAAVDDSYQRLQMTIDAVKKQVAADFAPAAQKAMELFSSAVQKAGEFLERSGLIENLASIITSMMSILEAIGKTISNLPGLGSALDNVNNAMKAVAYTLALIADTINVIAGLLPSNWGSGMARTALGWNMDEGQLSNIQQLKYGSGEYATSVYDEKLGAWVGNGYNASGNDNWRGGLTWVGEAGPELVALPRGSQIMNAQDSVGFGGDTYYISIDASRVKEFNDIIEIAQSARVRGRMR